MKATTFTFIVGLILGLIIWLTFELIKTYEPHPTANRTELTFCYPNNELNFQNVYDEIVRLDIKFSEKVLRQTLVESTYYKSHNCLARNNITGMKGGNKTFDNKEGYKIFDSWQDCMANYKEWQEKRLTNEDVDYYKFLLKWGYHEGGEKYKNKCEGIRLIFVKI